MTQTAPSTPDEEVRYSDIRRPSTPGIFGLSTVQSGLLVGAAIVLILISALGHIFWALGWLLLVALLMLPLFLPSRDGRNLYSRLHTRITWKRAHARGETRLVSGPTGHVPDGKCRLPGLLTASELREFTDAYGIPFGLLTVPSTGHHTVVIEASATGRELTDPKTVDTQVAHFGAWLASLGSEGGIDGASVTVETAPDSGLRLRRNVERNLDPAAPDFALAVASEIVDTHPAGGAQITTRITLTFAGRGHDGRKRSLDDMVTEIGNRLPMLIGSLRSTGAGTAPRACTAQDIIDFTRVAFDPSVAMLVEQARSEGGTGLTWDEAGPVLHDAGFDTYRHDRAWSRTWQMSAAPRGVFFATSLSALLEPHRDIARKRVTILYRPQDPINAAAAVESDINTAAFQASQRRRASARSKADLAAAERAAAQEAAGAGLVRFGLVVTATVMEPSHLGLANRTIQALAAPARLRMREALGNQDVAFTAGLPLGLVLPHHMFIPPTLQDAF